MNLYILANPTSGGEYGKRACKIIHKYLTEKNIRHNFFLTDAKGQEKELLNQILPVLTDEDRFIILGGDGTLSLVLDVLPKDQAFGFITAGSGNDFARGCELSHDPVKALEAILQGQPKEFYAIRYQSNKLNGLAINSIGIGLDAAIAKATNESKLKHLLNKVKLGQISYFIIALSVLFHKKSFRAITSLSNFDTAFLLTLSKHPYFGGGIKIAPDASNQNSDIHLVEIDKVPIRQFPAIIKKILKGTHISAPSVHHHIASTLTISVNSTQPIQIDGETYDFSDNTNLHLTTEKRTIIK